VSSSSNLSIAFPNRFLFTAFVPRFIELLKENYNLYCDTSFARSFGPNWLINELISKYPEGLERVFFASDNPWGLFEAEYQKVEGGYMIFETREQSILWNKQK